LSSSVYPKYCKLGSSAHIWVQTALTDTG